MLNNGALNNILGRAGAGQQQNQIPGMNYLQQVPGLYQPYSQQGLSMSGNPTGYLNNLMSQYQPSQNYQLMQKALSQNAANTAAAGGQRGSQYDVAQQSDLTNRLLQGDMQQWIQNNLGIQGMGAQEGMQAATNIGSAYGNMSQLEFEKWRQDMMDQQAQQQSHNSMLGSLGSMVGTIGGSIFGGPIGGMIGNKLGGYFGGAVGGGGGGSSGGLPMPFQ